MLFTLPPHEVMQLSGRAMHMKVDVVESVFEHCESDMQLRIPLYLSEQQLPGRRLLGLLSGGCPLGA